jgi:hypothetical protein
MAQEKTDSYQHQTTRVCGNEDLNSIKCTTTNWAEGCETPSGSLIPVTWVMNLVAELEHEVYCVSTALNLVRKANTHTHAVTQVRC